MFTYLFLIIGFIILIKGADLLVEGASSIAARFKISNLVIGLTIVAFGTSAPELFVNIISSIKGDTGIAVGNVLGSNIANILLVLGVCSIIRPLTVGKGTVWKEIPFCLLAALVLFVLANDQIIDKLKFSALTRIDGLCLLAFFVIFMSYAFSISKKDDVPEDVRSVKSGSLPRAVLYMVAGLVGLSLGGKWIVSSAIQIAQNFGISQTVIGLTVVAIGTTLPELATSIVSIRKGNIELAVGNVVGSNIFNIFLVLGISAVIRPLPFQISNNIDMGMVILSSSLLFLSMFTLRKRILDRWEGIVFLSLYVGYIGFLFLNK